MTTDVLLKETIMVQRLALLLACLSYCAGIAVPDDVFPKRLVGLLTPGMHVGYNSATTPGQRIEVVAWSQERFEMELDARKMPIAELSRKYPAVAAAAARLKSTQDPRMDASELAVQWSPLYAPATVLHVGDDYVLIQSAESDQVRLAIPADRILAIRWGLNAPTLFQGPAAEPSGAPESASRAVSKTEDHPRGPGDR
ncbi:hypothetical protein [Stieleria maiorica]|nr:hypothetical protein [Stieleria maiorica]